MRIQQCVPLDKYLLNVMSSHMINESILYLCGSTKSQLYSPSAIGDVLLKRWEGQGVDPGRRGGSRDRQVRNPGPRPLRRVLPFVGWLAALPVTLPGTTRSDPAGLLCVTSELGGAFHFPARWLTCRMAAVLPDSK